MSTDRYNSPLSERYASKEMQYIFSPDMKFRTWRKLWIALAETEMELGLSEDGKPVITQEQIDELKSHVDDINYEVAKEREKQNRHNPCQLHRRIIRPPDNVNHRTEGEQPQYKGDTHIIIAPPQNLQQEKHHLYQYDDGCNHDSI